MSVPKCLFFQDLEGLTEVFGRMSAGISGQKLPLWAEFSFLKKILAFLGVFPCLFQKKSKERKIRERLHNLCLTRERERERGSFKLAP